MESKCPISSEARAAHRRSRSQIHRRNHLETIQQLRRIPVRRGIQFFLIAITLAMAMTLAACFTMQKVGCDLLQLTSCPTATPAPE
jgi:predicted small secreted protein